MGGIWLRGQAQVSRIRDQLNRSEEYNSYNQYLANLHSDSYAIEGGVLASIHDSENIIGYSYASLKHYNVVNRKVVGFANAKLNSKYKTTTIQSIASIRISVMGVALMKAVDEKSELG